MSLGHATRAVLRALTSTHALGTAHGAHFAGRTAAGVKQVRAIGLETRHPNAFGHGEPGQNLAALGVDVADVALVTFPCAMPECPVDPRHSRDEAVRLDRAQDRARLGVDLVDLPVAVLPDPERALCPRHARVVTLAGRRKGGDDRSGRGVDFLNAIAGELIE